MINFQAPCRWCAQYWAQNLNVADGIEAEAVRDTSLHQFDDPGYSSLGVVRLHKVEVAAALGPGEISW
jgi:hypothetical protein